MLCSNCQNPLPVEASFCGSCGAAVNKQEKSTKHETGPNRDEPAVNKVEQSTKAFMKGLQKYKLAIGGTAGAVLLVLVVLFLIVPLFSRSGGQPVVYLGKNQLLMQGEKGESAIELSRSIVDSEEWEDWGWYSYRYFLNNLVKVSDDHNKMFFIKRIDDDNRSTLYYRDLKKKASHWDADQGVKLASGISYYHYDESFTMNSNGQYVLYMKGYDSEVGGKLYFNDLSTEIAIDSGVTRYWHSDSKALLYYTKANDGDEDLYVTHMNKPEDRTKVDNDINYVVKFDDQTGELYYTKYDETADFNSLSVYYKNLQGDKQKLLSDVNSIASDIMNHSFYYTTVSKQEYLLSSFVEDDMSASDAEVTEPLIENYQTTVNTPYTDWFGDVHYEDVVQTDYDAYDAAFSLYRDKTARDYLREALREESITERYETLHLFNRGETTLITDDLYDTRFADPANQTVIYNKYERKSVNKMRISDLQSIEDVRDAYSESATFSEDLYWARGSVLDYLFTEPGFNLNYIQQSSDGRKLYAIASLDESSELVSYDISDGKPTNRALLDDDVYSLTNIPQESKLYYYKNVHDGTGDLYVLENNKGTRIAIDVRLGSSTYDPEADILVYMTDYYERDGTGALHMHKNGSSTKLTNESGPYFYQDEDNIFFLSNYNSDRGYGDLKKLFDKGQPELISEQIYAMHSPNVGYQF